MGYLKTVEIICILLTTYTIFLVAVFALYEKIKCKKRSFEHDTLKALLEKVSLHVENIDAKTSQMLNENDIVRLFNEKEL